METIRPTRLTCQAVWATGKTREQVTRNMHEAIEVHVRGLQEDKLPVLRSHAFAEYVAVM